MIILRFPRLIHRLFQAATIGESAANSERRDTGTQNPRQLPRPTHGTDNAIDLRDAPGSGTSVMRSCHGSSDSRPLLPKETGDSDTPDHGVKRGNGA